MRDFGQNEKKGPALIFLSTPTRDHVPIFTLENLAHQATIQLRRAADEAQAELFGYALLPSVLYAIVGFRGAYDLAEFVYHYKWLSGRAMIAQEHGEFHERLFRKDKFRPWMGRFDNLTLCTIEQFRAKLDYIHNEPVKKGLVGYPTDWEFSSARDWAMDKPGLIKISKDLAGYGLI